MVPRVTPNWTDHEVEAHSDEAHITVAIEPSSLMERTTAPEAHELVDATHEGPEMAWAGIIVLGTLVLLVSTGLGVAVALQIDFAAWLLGGVLLVLVIVLEARVMDRAMLRTLTVNDMNAQRIR